VTTSGQATGGILTPVNSGIATVTISDQTAEDVVISLVDAGSTGLSLAGTSQTVSFTHGPAESVEISVPASQTVDSPLAVVISTQDQFGNLATDSTFSVTFTVTSDGTVNTFTNSLVDGTFTHLHNVTTPQTVEVSIVSSDGGLTLGGTASSVLSAGATHTVQVLPVQNGNDQDPTAPGSADTGVNVHVVAFDQFGNVVESESRAVTAGLTGSATFQASGSNRLQLSLAGGNVSAHVENQVAELVTIFLIDTEGIGADVSSTQQVRFAAGAPVAFAILPVANHEVGTYARVIVQLQDAFGNRARSQFASVDVRATGFAQGAAQLDIDDGESFLFITDNVQETVTFFLQPVTGFNFGTSSVQSMQFTAAQPLNPDTFSRVVEVQLTESELEELRRIVDLVDSINTTFIALAAGFVQDTFGNPSSSLSSANAIGSSSFTPDTSPPFLEEISMAAVAGRSTPVITLSFSEVIDASSLDASKLLLVDQATGPTFNLRLTGHTLLVPNTTTAPYAAQLEFALSDTDYEALLGQSQTGAPGASGSGLLRSTSSAFAFLDLGGVLDTFGTPNAPTLATQALQFSSQTADVTPPHVAQVDLNLTASTLTVTFSEAILPASFTASAITIQNDATTPTASVNLSNLTRVIDFSSDNTTVVVHFLLEEKSQLSLLSNLATSRDDSFFVFAADAAADTAGIACDAILSNNALQFTTVDADAIPPQLLAFNLNMNTGLLVLTFDEIVNAATFDVTSIRFASSTNPPSSQIVALTGGDASTGNGNILHVNITTQDLDAIKKTDSIGLTRATTLLFTSSQPTLVKDMGDNSLVTVSNSQAIQVGALEVDATSPQLSAWTFNMSSNIIVVGFDEPVRISSINPEELTLVGGGTRFNVTASTVVSQATGAISSFVELLVGEDDMNHIKALPICDASNNGLDCGLAMTNLFVQDVAGNSIRAISTQTPSFPIQFSRDTTPPSLETFVSFNLETGRITLLFSETIDASTVDVTKLTLQSSFEQGTPEEGFSHVSLTNSASLSNGTSETVVIQLSQEDLETIQEDTLVCTRRSDCYITLEIGFLQDTANNNLAPVVDGFPGRVVQTFIRD
jgi:hypothetical protein